MQNETALLRICLAMIAGVTAMAVPALSATEYFVAKGRNDGADGRSEKAAFATVGKGVSALKAGDTLTILPGTYSEAVFARISGAPDAPITIRAKRPGTVLLRGDVDAPTFRRVEGLRYTHWAEFKPRVEGVAERSTFRMYEPMLSLAEVELNPATFYQDTQIGRLCVHTSDSANPNWHALSLSVTNGFGLLLTPPPGSQTVHDVVVDGLSFTGYQARDYPPEPGSRSRWGLHIVMGERVTVRRCTAFLNNGGIYLLAAVDSLVEDCHAFANVSRFQPLGNDILGWSVTDTTFRRNVVEAFQWRDSDTSLAFYGGARYDKKPVRGAMESNLVINTGLMIKGAFGEDSLQKGNVVVGGGAYFYRKPDATNLLLPANESETVRRTYADPINHDYRLQSDAPTRGTGPNGQDPAPHPYRDEVFFVSPTGDDSASGTSLKQAWRTLSHAARSAKPGHTIYVTAGEYREALIPAQSGTGEQPIQFLRYARDRVALNGERRLPVGLDLSGRSHIVVRGFLVRDFARHGILAQGGENLRIERVIVTGSQGEGILASGVTGLTLAHNLVRHSIGAGVRLEKSAQAMVTGNILDVGRGPRLHCDSATLAGLWSDGNAFPPGKPAEPLVMLDRRAFASLEAWQKASGLDPSSVAAEAGYRAPESDFALRPDSPLIGRGPNGSTMGPYLRVRVRTPLRIENLAVHKVTASTADLEWWTPTGSAPTTLEWGETAKCEHRVAASTGAFHTASLIGLKPGARYFFRVTSEATGEELRFAPWAEEERAAVVSARPEPQTFETAARSEPPRVFHVAVTGDDRRSGASAAGAWRTISHAASQVRAGDTVLIHAGTYEEFVLVRASGDAGAPITFRAAPGETVWMEGSNRFRSTAFRLAAKYHVHIDGIRFRHFRYVPHAGDVISIADGSNHVIRRCFHDGREIEGYMANFVRAVDTRGLLVENCVMINGMGEGLIMQRCPDMVVRHCVFYNNFIRALTAWQFDPKLTLTLSHNLFCDTIPEKTANAFIRLSHLESLRSEHNGYFARKGPGERRVVEAANIGGKPAGFQGDGQYYGANLLLEDVQKQAGQETGSLFGNPGIPAVKELLPSGAPQGEWRKVEMHWDGQAFQPLDFADFMTDPAGPFARAADGKPIGLDPEAFR